MPLPSAILFDLFDTLATVRTPEDVGQRSIPEILGVPAASWTRLFYEVDAFGRNTGRVRDPVDAMRLVAHAIDPTVAEEAIVAAVEARRNRFAMALREIGHDVLSALDLLRGAGIRLALVSDAAVDDLEAWPSSPLRDRFDYTVFSHVIGCCKPDPRIYLDALSGVATAAHDATFVGDGGSDELRGARMLGMRTVLVSHHVARRSPALLVSRRRHADHEFRDVPAFVDDLLATGSRAAGEPKARRPESR